MSFADDVHDAPFAETRRVDARTRLERLIAELADDDVRELLEHGQRLELARHLEHERRRP